MKDQLIDNACTYFNIDKVQLMELVKKKDLYSALSEMVGLPRESIKNLMHGFAYGKDKFKC